MPYVRGRPPKPRFSPRCSASRRCLPPSSTCATSSARRHPAAAAARPVGQAGAAAAAAEEEAAVAAARSEPDRFGLSWRPEYAASILGHADEIDIVEIIADNFLRDSTSARSLRTLSAQIPVTLHSVALGLASSIPV